MLDRALAQTEREQLGPGHNALLLGGKRGQLQVEMVDPFPDCPCF
jgi:hypothetical protein